MEGAAPNVPLVGETLGRIGRGGDLRPVEGVDLIRYVTRRVLTPETHRLLPEPYDVREGEIARSALPRREALHDIVSPVVVARRYARMIERRNEFSGLLVPGSRGPHWAFI